MMYTHADARKEPHDDSERFYRKSQDRPNDRRTR